MRALLKNTLVRRESPRNPGSFLMLAHTREANTMSDSEPCAASAVCMGYFSRDSASWPVGWPLYFSAMSRRATPMRVRCPTYVTMIRMVSPSPSHLWQFVISSCRVASASWALN